MKLASIQRNIASITVTIATAFAFEIALANTQTAPATKTPTDAAKQTGEKLTPSKETASKEASKEKSAKETAPKETAPKAASPSEVKTPAATPAKDATASTQSVDGLVHKVVAKKKEIYVNPADGSKKMEFYFPENAQYLKAGQTVGFDALKEGQRVRVSYTKTGKRLNPVKVEILD